MKAPFKFLFILPAIFYSCGAKDDSSQSNSGSSGNSSTVTNNTAMIPVLSSTNAQFMYGNCENVWKVSLVNENAEFNPVVEATQAIILPKVSDKSLFSISPKGDICMVTVLHNPASGGSAIKLSETTFGVHPPPKPSIILIANGIVHNGVSPIQKNSICVVKIRPVNYFLENFPKDAKYIIESIDLLAQSSLGAPVKIASFSGSGKDAITGIQCELRNLLNSQEPMTLIYFKINKIYRVNFQNQKFEEDFLDRELFVSAVLY